MSYIEESLAKVHKEVSPSLGELCIALSRRNVSMGRIRIWIVQLRKAADDLERLCGRMEVRR